MKRRRFVTVLVAVLGAAGVVTAGGIAVTRSLGSGDVAVTNAQANTVWYPSAVLASYATPATGAVAVVRESRGAFYVLGAHVAAGATSVVWVADAKVPFVAGEVLWIRTPETNGVVQIVLGSD